ncbi:pilus assembly protein TadG-related protein [Pseudomonas fragi]|uniref:pilus assembly protein TadG-related protein n=1 Tax=Pseudomonas fragi TaxID=296 RepID=UPI00295337D4|nr:pilus assembly protein TadG-related protein [Pseudomonas fragi]WOL27493.1 pilus assembly protein TadG-related protein [Pseudomonas fragi]
MSPQLRGMGFYGPRQQHGAIGLMAAVTLGMVLLFMLLVVDSGRLYLEQRKLQRVADMAVLEAVRRGGNCAGASTAAGFANQSATRNSFTPGSVQKVNTTCGTLSTNSSQLRVFTADATKSDAIRVIATTTVPTSVAGGLWSMFSKNGFNLNTNLTASAVGSVGGGPLAQISIRSTLVTISSQSEASALKDAPINLSCSRGKLQFSRHLQRHWTKSDRKIMYGELFRPVLRVKREPHPYP